MEVMRRLGSGRAKPFLEYEVGGFAPSRLPRLKKNHRVALLLVYCRLSVICCYYQLYFLFFYGLGLPDDGCIKFAVIRERTTRVKIVVSSLSHNSFLPFFIVIFSLKVN